MARSSLLKALIDSNAPRPPVRRDIFWLCARYLRKDDALGVAARRLVASPTPQPGQWMNDLHLLIDATWETRFGHYTSSLRAQGAAMRLAERLKKNEWAA
jgi:hypothetical protein